MVIVAELDLDEADQRVLRHLRDGSASNRDRVLEAIRLTDSERAAMFERMLNEPDCSRSARICRYSILGEDLL